MSDIAPHARSADEVVASLGTDRARGLGDAAVSGARARSGWNELAEAPPVPAWKRLLAQFNELVIWILVVAAVVSGALAEWADAVAILAIVILNGVLGFIQEERAERALAALQKLAAPLAKVIRGGALASIPTRDVVPGDIVVLEAGDNVPADARLVEAFSVRVQEAALTGESVPVEKDATVVLAKDAPLGDRKNLVFSGTVVAAGRATAVVTATGMKTELGHIVGLIQRAETEPTPLQKRLAELGRILLVACGVIVAIIFALQMARGGKFVDAFLLSVSLAVAAVPEGLPAVVTVALALGLQRMAKRNAIIRKLPSVETLGAVTVICSDKTGTLTRNEMTVRKLMAGGQEFSFTGEGFKPTGEVRRADGSSVETSREPDLQRALEVGAFCNDSRVLPDPKDETRWTVVGDPTEGALTVAALKGRIAGANDGRAVVAQIPFSSDRKLMSVVIRNAQGCTLYAKGAPEVVLARCTRERRGGVEVPLTDERRAEIVKANGAWAEHALRVLGLAYRDAPTVANGTYEESDLTFSGLAGMIDPPREEAREAVARCREAGIRPVMITGDHPATAMAIARELGIAAAGSVALTGRELQELSDEELAKRVESVAVYARVTAEHKLRVVNAWKKRGQVVAMTGDGVNDAPALKTADIGIAMGITGTDAAKEASAMVLADDNFASIVNAVEEGRGIFDNVQKTVFFLLGCNAGEILLMLFAAITGWPAPLVPIQLLWMNLVTDGLPALALGMEPPEPDIMKRAPRPPREPVVTSARALLMLAVGMLIAIASGLGFAAIYKDDPKNLDQARTVAFCIMVFAQLFFSLSCRSYRYTMPELGPFTNPWLFAAIAVSALLQLSIVTVPLAQKIFETHWHGIYEWELLIGLSLIPVTIVEVAKLALKWSGRRVTVRAS